PAAIAEARRLLALGQQREAHQQALARLGLLPIDASGPALDRLVAAQLTKYRQDAEALGVLMPGH
ncbi:hypothetical protein, partial [Ideonella sp.]|uniref:hypothetical protein n=1 Tax=Ideonella sp. TaxID=1929293 RepID=UPI003BB59857